MFPYLLPLSFADSSPQEITENVARNDRKGGSSELTLGELVKRMESGKDFQNDESNRVGPKASYMVASAAAALKSGQALGADVLIVDPPRKGLEDEVLDELCKPFNPKQPSVESPAMLTVDDDLVNWVNDVRILIYVSCGFDALARDCDRLLSSRAGWKLTSATGYVLFPGSNHVETVCIFQRN
jgi:tRNA/tmRNA/rRNA uracil-C5-methylase (TrmA/RlmC/RlmD family)